MRSGPFRALEPVSKILSIVKNMTRIHFFFPLRSNFHVIDNLVVAKINNDKFVKVGPLYNGLKKCWNESNIERHVSVDEQMIPFKGNLNM